MNDIKCFLSAVFVISVSLIPVSGCRDSEKASVKLLIDSDMVQSFDDGIAMMMMFSSEDVDVLGLTTVTGNTWSQGGMAFGIRQAEIADAKSTRFIVGASVPLRENRLVTLNAEIDAHLEESDNWRGAVAFTEITDWKEHYVHIYGREPEFLVSDEDASEFIAEQIMSSPGEVTILAIGPCTNIAKALVSHPEMAALTKEIIYMGGAVRCNGNTTPYAEMNFLYDPEAAAICLRAPFPRQTLVSLDVCNTVKMVRDDFFAVYNSVKSEELKTLIRNQYYFDTFIKKPTGSQLVWDLISAAIVIDPGIITEYEDLKIDVIDDPESPEYGKSYISDNPGRQTVKVPLRIDTERFWSIVKSLISKY